MINRQISILSILFTIIIIGLLGSQLSKLQFDYELENFFPKNDADLAYYQKFSTTFGHDNDYLLLGFEAEKSLFELTFLESIENGLSQLASLEGTIRVISPTSLKSLIKTPLGPLPIPLLHISDSSKIKKDSVKLFQHPLYHEMFVSKSEQSFKAIVVHQRFNTKEEADEYVETISKIFSKQSPRLRIAGKAVAQTAFVNAVKNDFSKFILIAMVLIFILLLIFMRDLFMIITSLLISGLSVVTTIGLMAVTEKEIDVLSSLIPTILLVVSMSDIVHLFSHIRTEYQKTKELKSSINRAVRQVGMATLLTSFTTAIGFLTLMTINVKPIIDLGIYAAAGIMVAFVITYLLFPSIIRLTKPSFHQPTPSGIIQRSLNLIFLLVIRRSKTIIRVAILFFAFCLVGLWQLEIDAYLVNDLPKNDLVKSDFIFFDEEFSGSKPFTLSLWLIDSANTIYSKKTITQIEKVENLIKRHTKAGDLISPTTFVKLANQSMHNGSSEFYKLPESDKGWSKALRFIQNTHPERKVTKVSDEFQAQISGYFQDLGSRDATLKHKNLLKALKLEVDHNLIGYRLTGTTLLIDKSHELLSINLIKGLLLAILIVGLIAGWMFRSWQMVLITLTPNVFPILLVAAIMGYFSIPLNLSTSVIFAISFGIVVDDTIHFLSRFKYEYHIRKNKVVAIKQTIYNTGRPIIITTIVLTTGFVVFCVSNFSATFFMGLFVSISFVTALIADLFLLPVLLLWLLPNQNKNS